MERVTDDLKEQVCAALSEGVTDDAIKALRRRAETMEFAKVFNVDGEQVLFYLEPDDEMDDHEKLHQIVRIDGMCADVALGGLKPERADTLFADLSEANARNVLATVRSMFGG